jgi:hypothetical protein
MGARKEKNFGWNLSREQIARPDAANAVTPPYPHYPYWNGQFAKRTPPAVQTSTTVGDP